MRGNKETEIPDDPGSHEWQCDRYRLPSSPDKLRPLKLHMPGALEMGPWPTNWNQMEACKLVQSFNID